MTDEEMAEEYENAQDYCVLLDVLFEELKAGRPQWHDLRKNPNDLPEESVIVGLSERVIGVVEIAKNQYISQECRYDFVEKIWKIHKDPYVTDVIAWCEIPTFNKE
jgi:hypothetical protein